MRSVPKRFAIDFIEKGMAGTMAERLHPFQVLFGWIAKYCTKEMECRSLDEKRYFCSRGIPVPEVIYWRLHSDTMLAAVEVAVAVASEGNLDGMQWWCNNALGCVWIATAPGGSQDIAAPF